ncbi:OsmC family protein [Sedimentitalea sp.]|uniref:OsmC family protein n=1 Tax=Sedimentitalea sp. TaxID=2048915 RepID=UPI003298B446
MQHESPIKASLERLELALQTRPSFGHDTTLTRAVISDGFKTNCYEGKAEWVADMPIGLGGTQAGPTPGVFGRACLTSCIVMGIRIAAERRGVRLDRVASDLSMDWDSRGLFGMGDVSPGPSNITVKLTIDGDASETELNEIAAEGMRISPWVIALTQPHTITTDVTVSGRT